MSCELCTRAQNPHLRFLCPTCARNHLYQIRVDNATVLLEKECLRHHIESAVDPDSSHSRDGQPGLRERHDSMPGVEISKLWGFQRVRNEQVQAFGRLKDLTSQIERLRFQIKDQNLEISQRKLELARRRSDSGSAKHQLAERETGYLNTIRNNIKRTDHLWHSNHIKTAEARIFLCREAASLYSLRQKFRRGETGLKESYTIGGAAPDHISTSFSFIAHILVLISNYLSLRLPAEITLPHRNYPTPTIYTPTASYLPQKVLSTPSSDQSSSSPTIFRAADPHVPRPRPLCIDKPLPKLAKEDPATYGLFIEGVTLLAWDVSWLCRSQGLNLGSDSWEDVCDIGKNLWQLLVAPPGQSSTLVRALASRDIQAKIKTSKDAPRTTIQRTKSFPMLGHFSHGTAHSFLGASEGSEFIRNWRLPSPTKVVDQLKSTLLGEMASAEWELVEEKEWDNIPHGHSQPESRDPANSSQVAHTSSTVPTTLIHDVAHTDISAGSPRARGTSGWTKLRNRQ